MLGWWNAWKSGFWRNRGDLSAGSCHTSGLTAKPSKECQESCSQAGASLGASTTKLPQGNRRKLPALREADVEQPCAPQELAKRSTLGPESEPLFPPVSFQCSLLTKRNIVWAGKGGNDRAPVSQHGTAVRVDWELQGNTWGTGTPT